MDDLLTKAVLAYQRQEQPLEPVRNLVLLEAYHHLGRYRRKGEDEVSEFLLQFHGRIEGLLGRFKPQGLPFRHYLLRTLRWQWTTFRAERARSRRQAAVAADTGLGAVEADEVAEVPAVWGTSASLAGLSAASRKRLVLLALKASPFLRDDQLEAVSLGSGTDLAWLQACQQRLRARTDGQRRRLGVLIDKRGEAYSRRLQAEDDARRETDPVRRDAFERRARLYRQRLASLARQQDALSVAPTHRDLAELLGIPKGSVDSGLFHLKRDLGAVGPLDKDS